MDYETLNVLFQSRKTLMTILERRGYNTQPYTKFGPIEIASMAAASLGSAGTGAFRMDLTKLEKGPGISGCRVEYSLNRIKNKIPGFLEALTEEGNDAAVDPATTELIVILLEPIVEAFHVAALNIYSSKGLRVNFFQAHTIVNNPTDHVLVPKHEFMPPSEHAEFMEKNMIKSKTQLPLIKFHEDMIARIMGLLPGDIVKITRPSPSSGEYILYRLCVP